MQEIEAIGVVAIFVVFHQLSLFFTLNFVQVFVIAFVELKEADFVLFAVDLLEVFFKRIVRLQFAGLEFVELVVFHLLELAVDFLAFLQVESHQHVHQVRLEIPPLYHRDPLQQTQGLTFDLLLQLDLQLHDLADVVVLHCLVVLFVLFFMVFPLCT